MDCGIKIVNFTPSIYLLLCGFYSKIQRKQNLFLKEFKELYSRPRISQTNTSNRTFLLGQNA